MIIVVCLARVRIEAWISIGHGRYKTGENVVQSLSDVNQPWSEGHRSLYYRSSPIKGPPQPTNQHQLTCLLDSRLRRYQPFYPLADLPTAALFHRTACHNNVLTVTEPLSSPAPDCIHCPTTPEYPTSLPLAPTMGPPIHLPAPLSKRHSSPGPQ